MQSRWTSGRRLSPAARELRLAEAVTAVESLEHRWHEVAVVGERANDAPTLAAASLDVEMGAIGSAVVIETGTVVLMLDELS